MNHLAVTLPFIVFAALILVVLTKSDPRRQSCARKSNISPRFLLTLPIAVRQGLALLLIVPLILMLIMGNYAGVLMYAGAVTVLGWLISETPSSLL